MAPDYSPHDVDVELVFDRFLDEADLEVLRQRLRDLLPGWTRGLRVWRSRAEHLPIDIETEGSFGSIVTSAATAKGELYHRLVERSGPPRFDRRFGSAELRGSTPALTMVVTLDELIARPIGPRTTLGNRIALQVRKPTIERRPNVRWIREAFDDLCVALSPAWASAQHPGEYWTKVMSEQPSIQAVGRDFARFLPGVFWLNCFGPLFVRFLGEQTLLATPASEVARVGQGVRVVRGDDPRAWASSESRAVERRITEHLGAELFFDRRHPDRGGRAPEWGVAPGD